MRVVYGYPVQGSSDPYVTISDNAISSLSYAPGFASTRPAEQFPLLSVLPSWLPGMGWKRRVLELRELVEEMSERPWRWTKNELVSCLVRTYIVLLMTMLCLEGSRNCPAFVHFSALG
jgi:hypothetical protein